MSRDKTTREGTFIVAWSQTEVDGLAGAPTTALEQGATWVWRGEAIQIDGVPGIPTAADQYTTDALRRRAAAGTRNLIGRVMIEQGASDRADDYDRSFTLTNGHGRWVATLIDMNELDRPLLMFTGGVPPEGEALFVLDGLHGPSIVATRTERAEGVVCFTPGTMLETASGPLLVEDLVAGDRVVTKDNGSQEILWVGTRRVSGARLYAMPDLRPVRIREGALGNDRPTGDLIVSPDHRVLVTGAAPTALWGETEVLVAARDLIDNWSVSRDMAARSVTYIHLMLKDHGIVVANGVETESFHPGVAALDKIAEEQRLRLFDVMPALEQDPGTYGPMSRRVLSTAEAALLGAVA